MMVQGWRPTEAYARQLREMTDPFLQLTPAEQARHRLLWVVQADRVSAPTFRWVWVRGPRKGQRGWSYWDYLRGKRVREQAVCRWERRR